MNLFSGYLINDVIYILSQKNAFHPKNLQFLIHHLFSLALTISPYPLMYPDITTKLLSVERTIPIANALWFLNYYNKPPHVFTRQYYRITEKLLKIAFFIAFTYYRVIYLSLMSLECYQKSIKLPVQLVLYSIWAINISWYKKLLQLAMKS